MARIRLKIQNLGPQGDGTALGTHGPIYVERTAPGDELDVVLNRDKMGILRGEAIFFHSYSPFRGAPSCPHFESCGNCTLQHLSLSFYRKWKEEKVVQAFRSKGISPRQWLPPVFLEGNNRRRATFSLSKQKGRSVMGYYSRRSKNIIEIEQCDIALPELLSLKNEIEPLLFTFLKEGQTFDVFFQKSGTQWELVFVGWGNVPQSLLRELADLKSICRISTKLKNGIQVLHENSPLLAQFGPLKVALPPASFLQPTEEGEKSLVNAVVETITSKSKLADLFCGSGTFSGPLLAKGEVSAYESNPHAVRALRVAGKKYPIRVFERDLFTHPLRKQELNHFDAVVFDPPRAGCLDQAKELAKSSVPLLIGVSCNPATFARDATHLVRKGYQLESLQLIDQFLWSHHVEVIGVFRKF